MKKPRSQRKNYRLPRKAKKAWQKYLVHSAKHFVETLLPAFRDIGKAMTDVAKDILKFAKRTNEGYCEITKEEYEKRMITEFGCTKETASEMYELAKTLNKKFS